MEQIGFEIRNKIKRLELFFILIYCEDNYECVIFERVVNWIKLIIVEIFINCQNNEEGDFERIQTFKEILLVYVKER